MKYFTLLLLFLLMSCGTHINYLGDTYPPTHEIRMYFDESDIEHPYRVIGYLKNEIGEFLVDDMDIVIEKMKEKAMSIGADGLLFEKAYQTETLRNEDFSNDVKKVFEAKAIRYINE